MTPLDVVKCFYDSLVPGRRQNLMEILDPDVVIQLPEGMPCARPRYEGIKAYVEEFLFDLYGAFELDLVPEEYFVCAPHVTVLGRQKGTAVPSGVPYDVPFAHLWTVGAEGRITHVDMFTDTAVLRDAVAGIPVPGRTIRTA
jgi:ketosteroid isomerase-like protein